MARGRRSRPKAPTPDGKRSSSPRSLRARRTAGRLRRRLGHPWGSTTSTPTSACNESLSGGGRASTKHREPRARGPLGALECTTSSRILPLGTGETVALRRDRMRVEGGRSRRDPGSRRAAEEHAKDRYRKRDWRSPRRASSGRGAGRSERLNAERSLAAYMCARIWRSSFRATTSGPALQPRRRGR